MAFAVSPILMLLLFAASGAAALIYEIVWQQLLQLVIGSSTVSLGVLLGTFMGGMCLGSLYAPRLTSGRRDPLRVYAGLELAIGTLGLLLLVVMPLVTSVYTAWGGEGAFGLFFRALVSGVCLVPPTFAMGATLPIISRWVDRTPRGTSWLGFFYAGNIVGGVFGSLLAGFYLLRVFDMNVATYVAVSINLTVAAAAWMLARRNSSDAGSGFSRTINGAMTSDASPAIRLKPDRTTVPHKIPLTPDPTNARRSTTGRWRILVCVALSGFCALTAEVVWTRMLSLILSATVYTFSIILAVFLIGLGVGSSLGAVLARRLPRPALALGWCQLLTVVAMAWSARMLAASLPYWPINTALATSIWFNFQLDVVRTLWAILPAPILWGASFPLALAAVAGEGDDPGLVVGQVYAANTIGAIAGALGASLLLVAWIGSQHAQRVMMLAALLAGALVLVPRSGIPTKIAVGVAAAVTFITGAMVPQVPAVLVAYGRHAAAWVGHTGEVIYVGEGLHASVAVSRVSEGVLNYHNAGKIQASSQPSDMRLQRMLGHLTTIVPRTPRSVLVIGCGAGVTAGAVSVSPVVDRVTIVEIEPLVPQVAGKFFGSTNHEVLKSPKVRVIVDDARHFLMTTRETFDAITSDPLDPWVKGAASLYTKEFFNTARDHLNPGGVMTLFVQLYESSPEAVRSEVATFFETFPNGLIFGNTFGGNAIDTVLVGQVETPYMDLDAVDEALHSPAFAPVARSLGEIGFYSATDLFGNYAGRARDLKPWTAGAQINRDRNLRLQYLAGLSINLHEGDTIYHDILQYRAFPEDLFVGSASTLWWFRQALEGAKE
jgi:spermidine synthase